MNLNGMQVVVITQPGLQNKQMAHIRIKPRLAKQLIGLGVVHILNGVFCIIYQSISLEIYVNATSYIGPDSIVWLGHGFWCGLSFLVTGITGITGGIRKSRCQVVAFNILSIISAVLADILIIVGALSANFVTWERHYQFDHRTSSTIYDKMTTVIVMASMLVATGILEFLIAIWSSIVCYLKGVCNCCLASTPQTQPLILSAEQQAELMSNPVFLSHQQQPMGFFQPQQQTVQYNKQQPHAQPYDYSHFMPGSTVAGAYTDLSRPTRMIFDLPSSEENALTSIYEELHEYEEMELVPNF